MLEKGYLASNLVFSSLAHKPEIVDGYFEALSPIFSLIKEAILNFFHSYSIFVFYMLIHL